MPPCPRPRSTRRRRFRPRPRARPASVPESGHPRRASPLSPVVLCLYSATTRPCQPDRPAPRRFRRGASRVAHQAAKVVAASDAARLGVDLVRPDGRGAGRIRWSHARRIRRSVVLRRCGIHGLYDTTRDVGSVRAPPQSILAIFSRFAFIRRCRPGVNGFRRPVGSAAAHGPARSRRRCRGNCDDRLS